MSTDEGPEDEVEMNDEQLGMLEQMLRAHAADHFEKARLVRGGVPAYFQALIQDVTSDFKNQKMLSRSIYDFSVDRYIFYRRHREMDAQQAVTEAYIDTFEYLIQLKNEFPMIRPPMKDDWRH
jgi:hypothetical protein